MKIYKEKDKDEFIKVEGNRFALLGEDDWEEIVYILNYYEETTLTEEEALLIQVL